MGLLLGGGPVRMLLQLPCQARKTRLVSRVVEMQISEFIADLRMGAQSRIWKTFFFYAKDMLKRYLRAAIENLPRQIAVPFDECDPWRAWCSKSTT
jgi:hypothetical protein